MGAGVVCSVVCRVFEGVCVQYGWRVEGVGGAAASPVVTTPKWCTIVSDNGRGRSNATCPRHSLPPAVQLSPQSLLWLPGLQSAREGRQQMSGGGGERTIMRQVSPGKTLTPT